ncbi:SH3 domain-containing protein [Devosia enhydra]|uniref:SH3 domain-containing protein n=1 Tax=Devosia enhydra TaxID=665118 RepID=A0A1K2HYB1_9HYPH|nr:SH3 domain-containing protein [Devosia enhydra]SFZ84657.1 SH3 domain-containing protein [Devosia enhydra]
MFAGFHPLRALIAAAALAMAVIAAPIGASAQERSVEVRFPRGASGTTITDTIVGNQAVNYRIGVSAGQKMSVNLDVDNASAYFNITAPGASAALYNGSISGNGTSVDIPSSGTYVITVYLMRNAARRNERANYSLTLYVEGRAAAAPAPLPSHAANPTGPSQWVVQGLNGGTLNVRSSASTTGAVVGKLVDGDRADNLGCQAGSDQQWCRIHTSWGLTGWVAARYLHEDFPQAAQRPSRPPPQRPVAPPAVTLPSYPLYPQQVGPAAPVRPGMTTAEMSRYCAGEASARFSVRPQDITTNAAFQSGGNYVVQGWFDRGGSSTFFNCWFDIDGNFSYIQG